MTKTKQKKYSRGNLQHGYYGWASKKEKARKGERILQENKIIKEKRKLLWESEGKTEGEEHGEEMNNYSKKRYKMQIWLNCKRGATCWFRHEVEK